MKNSTKMVSVCLMVLGIATSTTFASGGGDGLQARMATGANWHNGSVSAVQHEKQQVVGASTKKDVGNDKTMTKEGGAKYRWPFTPYGLAGKGGR